VEPRPAGRSEGPERDPYDAYGAGERAEDRFTGYGFEATSAEEDPYAASQWPRPPREPAWRVFLRRLWAPIVGLALLVWKLKAAVFVVFKLKIFTTAASMLVSIGAYALFWGWQFAVGFVLLLLVHELGHALEAKRQGLDVSAPFFIPFLGAVIAMKQMPKDVWREAEVAIAGPIVGSLGAAGVWVLGEALDSDLLVALAFTGFLLNLFNLAPFGPLDGGRIVAAIHPAIWGIGLLMLLGLLFLWPNPVLILILVLGGMDAWRRWRLRNEPEFSGYYRIAPWKRLAAAAAYVTLAALLALAMNASYIERDF
jgi:Zn-dependent protease